LYEPFAYTAGERLGGAGTNPVGKVAPNGQTWITRSPATDGTYDTNRDTLITAGNLSYPGLAPSVGNSVRYGSSNVTSLTTYPYTDAIAVPGGPYTAGSVYYSMIVRFHSPIPTVSAARTCYAALSEDTAIPATDAGYSVPTAGGTGNIPLPAGAWIRYSGTTQYHLGAGKQNTDGLGTSAGSPAWQSATAYPNQQGEVAGAGQDFATIDSNLHQPYFIVLKYTFKPDSTSDDTVSLWVNPAATTLGHDDGEWLAGVSGGSYYSATNCYTTAPIDAQTYGIQSFLLIGDNQPASRWDKSIDLSLDELRIGTTWADVTPVPPPPAPQIISIAGAGTTSVTVTWTNVEIGTNYVLQYSTNLSATNWANLAPVPAAGTTASQTDTPPSGDPGRYYRVLKP
jgi:hypothetical protein